MNGSVVHYLDSSRCQERLGTMIHLARVLRSETGEATESGTLELLSILVDDDVIQLKEAHSLHEENVERLARAVNRPVSVVRSLLRQFLIKDLFDYQSYYAMRLAAYAAENKNGLLEKRLEMRYGDPKIVVPFLYHDVVYCWDTRDRVLSAPLDDDSRSACYYEGLLVERNHSFATTVELLDSTREKRWLGWEDLWKFF